jgi:YVTN family beta-propeller protein
MAGSLLPLWRGENMTRHITASIPMITLALLAAGTSSADGFAEPTVSSPATAYVVNLVPLAIGSMFPIDTATNTAGPPIKVGKTPVNAAVTPDSKTAYVVNGGSNDVTPVTVATNTAGKAIRVGTNPVTIAITPNGKTAYIVNTISNTVTPINTATNTTGAASRSARALTGSRLPRTGEPSTSSTR